MVTWSFTSLVHEKRRGYLKPVRPFGEVIADVLKTMRIESVDVDEPKDVGLIGAYRPSITLVVDDQVGDVFFNSASGYRGQYAESPQSGEQANRALLDALEERLTTAFNGKHFTLDTARIVESLRDGNAKVWPRECWDGFPWVDLRHEIAYGPWTEAAEAWLKRVDLSSLEGRDRSGARGEDRLAFWGVRAPAVREIEVKGAWIKPDGRLVAPVKPWNVRSTQIHEFGWS